MRYCYISSDDMLNGDGLRVVLWVAGCEHHCEGCHNAFTWDPNGGMLFDEAAKTKLFNELEKDYISGITFSGGDPLHPNNMNEVRELILEISEKYPDKTIWLYSGYDWDYIKMFDFVEHIDVVVDGEFVKSLNDNSLKWRGSSNQRVINVAKSLKANNIIEHIS